MTLKTSSQVSSHLKPYAVMIRMFNPGTFPSEGGGTDILATPGSVTITSDASPDTFSFTINDSETTIESGAATGVVPSIGDEILVRVSDVGSTAVEWGDLSNMFKGFVVGVSKQLDTNGSVYSVECSSMKARLRDEVVTKIYNEKFDNINKPNFDELDHLLKEESWTVSEIIDDIVETANNQILSMPAKHTPLIYFAKADFDYSEVPELRDFVPETISLENISVLESIHRVVTSAGTYRMVYDPSGDDIVFTRVSIKAHGSGSQRFLYYAEHDKTNPNKDYVNDEVAASYPLASGVVNVIRDNSVKRISDIASMYRMFSGKVEWYGGHSYIKSGSRNYDSTPNASGVYTVKNYNWDGYKYHFSINNNMKDGRDLQIIVGCPLYPQWVTSTGYRTPLKSMIKDYLSLDATTKRTTKESLAEVTAEYEGFSENDASIKSQGFEKYVSKEDIAGTLYGMVYEAWYPWSGVCESCDGTGAVDSVGGYAGHEEEWFGDSKYTSPSGSFEIGDRKRPVLTPFDYGFASEGGVQKPNNHPVPWKNMCPVCRGVGREPRFKITNISSSLVDLPPSKIRVEDTLEGGVTNRTWDEVVSEYKYSYPPQIQVERAMDGVVAVDGTTDEDAPLHPMAPDGSFTGIKPIANPDGTDPEDLELIIPAGTKIKQLFETTIDIKPAQHSIDYKRGNITFHKNAVFCKKTVKPIHREHKNLLQKLPLKDSVTKVTKYNDKLADIALITYWRPAAAWMTMYFTRDRYYDTFPTESSEYNSATRVGRNPKIFSIPPASGQPSESYKVQSSVSNGNYYCEIYRQNPDEGEEFDVRPVVKGKAVREYRWQICPDDIYNLPVPETGNYNWSATGELKDTFVSNEYYYPEGAVQVAETITQKEYNDNEALFEDDVVGKTIPYPKKISWVQRDDRYLLIQNGVRELEIANDIQITGNVVVRGTNYSLQNGLGYVTFDDGLKAVIVKMTHSFGSTFNTTLELSTEEYRIGEKTEKDKDTEKFIDRKIQKSSEEAKARLEALSKASERNDNKEHEAESNLTQFGFMYQGG